MRKATIAFIALFMLLPSCAPQDPQTQLDKAVKILSKQVPMKIDANTTCTKISSGKMKIIYTYEISGIPDKDITDNKKILENEVSKEMKKNKKELKAYIDNKIAMEYIYKNKEGKTLTSFTLKPWKL